MPVTPTQPFLQVSTPPSNPGGSGDKESACNVGDLGLILGLGRSPGEGKGYPLQYSGLENPLDYSPWDRKESDTTEQLSLSHVLQALLKYHHLSKPPQKWSPQPLCLFRPGL